ncbi:MAG TPA: type IV secretion protein DotN [Rhodospirillaceae bacterium]|nr:HNH endonuclease [Alphaproteobacteria bacterium]HBH26368.1 type IV secretion protein DotN [Rhodospirillaceae bacterium]
MKVLPITLGVSRGGKTGGAEGTPSGPAPLPPDLRARILKRDGNRCRCCGFEAAKYQEILHINGDHADTRPGNLATTCIFCHQCFHLDRVGPMESGVLIWMPEIPQAYIHHIARAIYVARITQGEAAAGAARRALEIIMARMEEAKRRIGTEDPFVLAAVLSDYLGPRQYAAREAKIRGLRLFPRDRRMVQEANLKFNQFPQILAYWRSKAGPFAQRAPREWAKIYLDIMAKAAQAKKAA